VSGTISGSSTVNNNGMSTTFALTDGRCTAVGTNGDITIEFGSVSPSSVARKWVSLILAVVLALGSQPA